MKRLEQIRSAQIRSLLCNFTTTCSFDFNEYGNASIYDKRAKTERRTIVTKEYDSQILSVVTNALSPIKVKVVAPGQGPVNATLLATSKLNFISARYGPAGLLDSSAGASLVGRLTLSLTNGVSYTREIEWSTPPPNKKRYLSDGASAYVTVNKGFEVAMSNLVADVFLGRNPKPGDLK
ncbi:MAG: hypothetical protein NTY53_26045 [Kiritimatiellaeota bacterium]|nr:hypothetical protein [Kiritimatiellota bacterium]